MKWSDPSLPTATGPALTDYLLGVTAAAVDHAWTLAQLAAALSPTPPNTQTGTSYTLALTDLGIPVEMNNASANTLTVPPHASVAFPLGAQVDVTQLGAGQTTIAAGAGVTILSGSGGLLVPGQYYVVTLYQRATDVWVLSGAIA